jgi:putative aldouronate transport system substrate-binding protein
MRKLISLFLVLLVMMFSFNGCSSKKGEDTTATPTPTIADTTATPAQEVPGQEGWLVDEPTTLTIWQPFSNTIIDTMEDNPVVAEIAKRTGITLKFIHPASGDEATAFQLMIASNSYPDIIRLDSEGRSDTNIAYPGGGEKAISDGVFIQLNDLIEQYAPNYTAIRARGDVYEKDTITDSGVMYAMYSVSDTTEPAYAGLTYRKDWADALGLGEPVTMEDWHTLLTAYKDTEGADAPLMIDKTGLLLDDEFLSSWNIGSDFYQVDGKVYYGYIQPEFKEYLTTMNKWYTEGLIDPDFIGNADFNAILIPPSYSASGRTGAGVVTWAAAYDGLFSLFHASEDANINFAPVVAPVQNEGDTQHFRFTTSPILNPWAITTSCKNPEAAVKFLDWCYTEEGSLLINYGIEGTTYTMVDGAPRFTDFILKNEDGNDGPTMWTANTWEGCPGLRDYSRGYQNADPKLLSACDVWNSSGSDYSMPMGLTLTSDEADEYSKIMADIQTYVDTNTPKFIIGTKSLDEYSSFVDELKSMKIERALEIKQAALDRYNNRK